MIWIIRCLFILSVISCTTKHHSEFIKRLRYAPFSLSVESPSWVEKHVSEGAYSFQSFTIERKALPLEAQFELQKDFSFYTFFLNPKYTQIHFLLGKNQLLEPLDSMLKFNIIQSLNQYNFKENAQDTNCIINLRLKKLKVGHEASQVSITSPLSLFIGPNFGFNEPYSDFTGPYFAEIIFEVKIEKNKRIKTYQCIGRANFASNDLRWTQDSVAHFQKGFGAFLGPHYSESKTNVYKSFQYTEMDKMNITYSKAFNEAMKNLEFLIRQK